MHKAWKRENNPTNQTQKGWCLSQGGTEIPPIWKFQMGSPWAHLMEMIRDKGPNLYHHVDINYRQDILT